MRSAASLLPAVVSFPPEAARQDAWGRLTRLTSGGAELSTLVRLVAGETVLLSFELGAERLERISARVARAADDADGHRAAELVFDDEVQRRRLAKVLTDALARG